MFRYVQLLLQSGRFEDALLIAQTCLKLDPYNGSVRDLIKNVSSYVAQSGQAEHARSSLQQVEDRLRKNPGDIQAAFEVASAYMQMQQTNQAMQVLEGVLNYPQANAMALRGLLQAFGSFGSTTDVEKTVGRLEAMSKANPADSDAALGLAEGYRQLGKNDAAMQVLDQLMNQPKVDGNAPLGVASVYAEIGNIGKLETALAEIGEADAGKPRSLV